MNPVSACEFSPAPAPAPAYVPSSASDWQQQQWRWHQQQQQQKQLQEQELYLAQQAPYELKITWARYIIQEGDNFEELREAVLFLYNGVLTDNALIEWSQRPIGKEWAFQNFHFKTKEQIEQDEIEQQPVASAAIAGGGSSFAACDFSK
jgi:hypothetical protein